MYVTGFCHKGLSLFGVYHIIVLCIGRSYPSSVVWVYHYLRSSTIPFPVDIDCTRYVRLVDTSGNILRSLFQPI